MELNYELFISASNMNMSLIFNSINNPINYDKFLNNVTHMINTVIEKYKILRNFK